jgi:hypothetical protein
MRTQTIIFETKSSFVCDWLQSPRLLLFLFILLLVFLLVLAARRFLVLLVSFG